MKWFCPTYGRPHRLMDMLQSWPAWLMVEVIVGSKDPKIDEYMKMWLPANATLHVVDAEWCTDKLNWAFEQWPNEDWYGFVADDIVLKKGNPQDLNPGPWGISYPDDQIQRWALCTHFCIGGELARTLGYLAYPELKHHYIDVFWMSVGKTFHILHYHPEVVFEHKHHLVKKSEKDAVYSRADAIYEAGGDKWEEIHKNNIMRDVIQRVGRAMLEVTR